LLSEIADMEAKHNKLMSKLKKDEQDLVNRIKNLQDKIDGISSQLQDARNIVRGLISQLNDQINECRGLEGEIKQNIEEFNRQLESLSTDKHALAGLKERLVSVVKSLTQ